jgi:hypothetical protein
MKKHSVFQMVPLTAAIALLIVCTGCDKKKDSDDKGASSATTPPPRTHAHNLEFVQCSSKNGEGNDVTIEVTAAKPPLKAEDRVIFVCPHEMVSWHTSIPNAIIVIHLKDATLFTTQDTDLKSTAGPNGGATTPKEVGDTAASDLSHAYTVKLKNGSDVFEMDPHIIPVGN